MHQIQQTSWLLGLTFQDVPRIGSSKRWSTQFRHHRHVLRGNQLWSNRKYSERCQSTLPTWVPRDPHSPCKIQIHWLWQNGKPSVRFQHLSLEAHPSNALTASSSTLMADRLALEYRDGWTNLGQYPRPSQALWAIRCVKVLKKPQQSGKMLARQSQHRLGHVCTHKNSVGLVARLGPERSDDSQSLLSLQNDSRGRIGDLQLWVHLHSLARVYRVPAAPGLAKVPLDISAHIVVAVTQNQGPAR